MIRPLLLFVCTLTLLGCGRDASDPRERSAAAAKASRRDLAGTWVSPREYHNPFFGLRITIPEDWELKKGTSQETNQQAVDFLAGDEKNLQSVMKSAIAKTETVFWAYRHPVGTPGKSNPNVSMLLEPVAHLPGIKSAEDYLLALEQTFKMSNKAVTFPSPSRPVELGGVAFTMRGTEMAIGSLLIRQRFYSTLKDRTVLLIGVTTMTEADAAEVAKITDTIKAL